MSKNDQKSLVSLLLFGSLFIFVGAFVFLMAVDVISVPDEDINSPRWVLAAVGMVFALAGAMVMVNGVKSGFGDSPLYKWIYNGMVLIFLIIFAAPFHWVAFGSGERTFTSSTGVGGVSVSQSGGDDIGGRLAFACGAVLMDLFILFMIYRLLQGKNISEE